MSTLLDERADEPADAPVPTGRAARTRGDLIAVVLAAALVTASSVVGWALIRRGVPIHVDFPPLLATWLPHVGPGTVPAVVVALVVALQGPALAERLPWPALLVTGYAASLAWTFSLALIDGWTRGIAGRLTTDTEYLAMIPIRGGVGPFLADFARRIPSFQIDSLVTHVSGHPPAATLFYEYLYEIGLGGGDWAGAITIVIGASAVVPVAVTLAVLADRGVARRYLPFGVLFPGAVWVGVSADGLFAAVFAWGVALVALAAVTRGVGSVLLGLVGGLVLGMSLFLSYGLALGVLVPVVVAALRRRITPLLTGAVGVAAVFALFAVNGFWWLDGYEQVKVRYYQPGEFGLLRPYDYWVWANLAALVLVVGPAVVAGLRRCAWSGWPLGLGRLGRLGRVGLRSPVPAAVVLLVGAAVLAVLGADLSGLSKAETERIWLPFAVWMMPAATLLSRPSARWWLLGQAVVALLVNHLFFTTW